MVGFHPHVPVPSAGPSPAVTPLPRRPRRRGVHVRLAAVLLAALSAASVGWVVGAGPADAATCVYISTGRFDAAGDDAKNLNGEYVVLRNRCASLINIKGWRILDRQGNRYIFASLRMGTGTLTLHTGSGTAVPGHRYWGRTNAGLGQHDDRAGLSAERERRARLQLGPARPAPAPTPAPTPKPTPTPTPKPTRRPPPSRPDADAAVDEPVVGGLRDSARIRRDQPDELPRPRDREQDVQGSRGERHRDPARHLQERHDPGGRLHQRRRGRLRQELDEYHDRRRPLLEHPRPASLRDGHNRGNFVQFNT